MSNKIVFIQKFMDKTIFNILSIVLGIMVIMVVAQVFARFILNNPSMVVEELLRFSLIWAVMLGAISAFIRKEHIALTLFIDKAPAKVHKVLSLIINIIIIAFLGIVMVYGGTRLCAATMKQITPLLNIPMGFVYSIIPISGTLMTFVVLLQSIELLREKINLEGQK
ncbi:MAG: TRAP transporter small permease [Elusimicrobiota bacterium]|jgi:TRAP-type C4-dicarboxylate transport system permease small subunit|nr:TRAP transporter small permease [Elusimicrobiota bacterium]